ncbi:MAG: hypothetical protein J7L69_07295, partial [Desulfobulbaceae bacterium]|nr:hypothetical protein [Desulfobulbaceae bacterium]
TISWHASRSSKALVQIFDRDMYLVRELMSAGTGNPGMSDISWDGRDLDGNIVPDEAYFFTIEANEYGGGLTHYDPATFSGGESFDFPMEFDRREGMVAYELPKDSRILTRAGITHGPLLKTIVNWAPRPAGVNQDPWDGKDTSGILSVAEQKGFIMMSDAVTLPENSILTIGNNEYAYSEYKNKLVLDRPVKEKRPRIVPEKRQPYSQFPRYVREVDELRFYLELPQELEKNEPGLPIVSGKLPIRIYLDKKVKRSATERRYEIICYVDFKFITEHEEGYSPSTWMLNTKKIPNGEHILTVNIATLKGQMASASYKVFVQN